MDQKLLYIDTETSGTLPWKHGIHQVACLVEINGKIVEEVNIKLAIREGKEVDTGAMEKLGVDPQEITKVSEERISDREAYLRLSALFKRHVDPYKKQDKFFFLSYNAGFDNEFLRRMWQDNGDRFFGSFFWNPYIDIMTLAAEELMLRRPYMKDFKLETVYREMIGLSDDEDLEWHDALADIKATRSLYRSIPRGGV